MRQLALAILMTSGLFAATLWALSLKPGQIEQKAGQSVGAPLQMEAVRHGIRNVTPPQMTQPPPIDTLEIARLPAIVAPPVPPRPAKPVAFNRPEVVSAGVIRIEGARLRLHGIAALERDAVCLRSDGSNWPCGSFARTAMQRFIRQRTLDCLHPQGHPLDTSTMAANGELACSLSGQDLSTWLVEQGWAKPAKPGRMDAEMALARREQRGQWGDGPAQ